MDGVMQDMEKAKPEVQKKLVMLKNDLFSCKTNCKSE